MKKLVVYSTQLMQTGGIESHLLEFCKQMSGKDVCVDLIVPNSQILASTEEAYRNVCRNLFLGRSKNPYKRILWLILVALKLRFNEYDALYTNGQGDSIGIIAKLLRIKGYWVHHHHTSGDKEDQATWGKKYLSTLKKANKIIACSVRNAHNMSIALNKSIDTIPCFSRKITIGQPVLEDSGKIKFGYYGRLIPEKGIDLICKMSEDSDLSNVEFHIWGEGEAYPPSHFEKFPRVHYHGTFVGLSGLTDAIALINAFLLLSIHPEGLPISLLEAMSAGLPWLATDRGGIPDIACDPSSTRIISAASTYDQFKQAIKTFAGDISQGKVSKDVQERLYAEKFSSTALVRRWSEALNLNFVIN